MEFVNPYALMALLRASRATKDLINQYSQSISRGIAEQQYPEVLTMATWLFQRERDLIDSELSQAEQVQNGCEMFNILIRYFDSIANKDSRIDLDHRYQIVAELDSEESPLQDWMDLMRRSRWGTLSYMDNIAAVIRRVILKLAHDKIIVRDPNFKTNGFWELLERVEYRSHKGATYFVRSKCGTTDLERAVYLFWKLHYLLMFSGGPDQLQVISDQDRIEFLNYASPKPRKVLQLLVEIIAFELSQRPAVRAFTHYYDPSMVNEEGLSAAQRSLQKRTELVIRREQEYLIVSDIIFLGPRIMDSYGDNEDELVPGGSELRSEYISEWLEEDRQLTEEESQAAWEDRDLVYLGLLSKEPDARLMMGLEEWRDIYNEQESGDR